MHRPPSHGAYCPQGKEVFFVQTFYKICLILLIVGGINWGLVGLFTLVGIAALCGIPGLFSDDSSSES